jgi:predicted nuclease of restriction endonuclease-like (RecB) superfamily
LAKDLSAAFPGVKGFSRANLFFIWKWYRFYRNPVQPVQNTETEGLEFVSQVVRQIPWGHNREIIMKCSNVESALFYVRETIKNNWSRTMLVLQIESKLYERQGKAIQNFQTVLPTPQADLARETLKNPYNFDFLTLGREAGERDLETALTDHIQKFLLELGQGFAYMGRQFPINVGGDDFYLNAVNAQLKHPQDQPSIGILLCKTPNKVMVEYSLENIFSPLGVSEYRITSAVPEDLKGSLPSIEALEQELGDS